MWFLVVAGARPNFVKIAPIMDAWRSTPAVEVVLVHTGQHYDYSMSAAFFENLKIPRPDVFLGVSSANHSQQTARILAAFEDVLFQHPADGVVGVGDVNSTLACALAAAKSGFPVAHIEAGLRSFDRTMPEEINRVLTDALAEYLFARSADADDNLPARRVSRGVDFSGRQRNDRHSPPVPGHRPRSQCPGPLWPQASPLGRLHPAPLQ